MSQRSGLGCPASCCPHPQQRQQAAAAAAPTCVEPVSWFSRKVTAREGHQPMRPGGLPAASLSRQYSQRSKAACRMPLVVMSVDGKGMQRCTVGGRERAQA